MTLCEKWFPRDRLAGLSCQQRQAGTQFQKETEILAMHPLELPDARKQIRQHARPLASESVALSRSLGRWLADSVSAVFDHPPFDQSLRDGVAVGLQTSPQTPLPIVASVHAGQRSPMKLAADQACIIMTGAPLPDGATSVEMVERVKWMKHSDGQFAEVPGHANRWQAIGQATHVVLQSSLPSGQYVLPRGSIFRRGETLLTPGKQLQAIDIALLASANVHAVDVVMRPKVSILVTGDEVVSDTKALSAGQIYNSNGPLLENLAKQAGLQIQCVDHLPDQPERIGAWIERQWETSDLILTTGGVSAGEKDYLPALFEQANVQNVFHGVRIKPGKPVWFGVRHNGDSSGSTANPHAEQTYVFGLPGNPVSCLVTFRLLVQPLIDSLLQQPPNERWLQARLLAAMPEGDGRATLWPAKLEWRNEPWAKPVDPSDINTIPHVSPLDWKGSPDLRTLTQADAWIYWDSNTKLTENGIVDVLWI